MEALFDDSAMKLSSITGQTHLRIGLKECRVSESFWFNWGTNQHVNKQRDCNLWRRAFREASDDGVPSEEVWVSNSREDQVRVVQITRWVAGGEGQDTAGGDGVLG